MMYLYSRRRLGASENCVQGGANVGGVLRGRQRLHGQRGYISGRFGGEKSCSDAPHKGSRRCGCKNSRRRESACRTAHCGRTLRCSRGTHWDQRAERASTANGLPCSSSRLVSFRSFDMPFAPHLFPVRTRKTPHQTPVMWCVSYVGCVGTALDAPCTSNGGRLCKVHVLRHADTEGNGRGDLVQLGGRYLSQAVHETVRGFRPVWNASAPGQRPQRAGSMSGQQSTNELQPAASLLFFGLQQTLNFCFQLAAALIAQAHQGQPHNPLLINQY